MRRRVEFILGIIAGIIGILSGIFDGVIGDFMQVVSVTPIMIISNYFLEKTGTILVILSILGIVGAILANSNSILAGIFMLVAAFGGFLISMFVYILPATLFTIAGLMCFLRTPKYDE